MLTNQTESRNYSAASVLADGDTRSQIAFFTAQLNEDRHLYYQKNIQDYELYKANKVMVEADYAAFQEYVEDSI